MPSLLGLQLGRFDPSTSKPSRGWCNEIPLDESDAESEWEEYIRRSLESNQFNNESVASLKIEEASEEAIEHEIEKVQRDEVPTSSTRKCTSKSLVLSFHSRPVRVSKTEDLGTFNDVIHDIVTGNNAVNDEIDEFETENEETETEVVVDTIPEDPFDDFDDSMIFALTPETCPGPPPPPPPKIPLRIFVATWNMAAEDPFAHRRRGQYIGDDLATDTLRELLPLGYDIYVIGTQEKVTKHLNAAVLARLKQQPTSDSPLPPEQAYKRLPLTSKRREVECRHQRTYESSDFESSLGLTSFCGSDVNCSPKSSSVFSISPNASFSCSETPHPVDTDATFWRNKHEEKEIRGHGDHALLRRKSTGLSVYYASHLHGSIEAVAAGSHKFTGSKGGIAVTIRMAGDSQTLTFVNCHLEANRLERRRRQLDKLARELPRSLSRTKDGESTLATCSDHVVWMGDFNYRIQSLDGDEVLQWLSAGRLQELHDHYDSMAADLAHVPGFQSFREPAKWPTFYPTYKKVASRSRLPLSGSTTGTGRDTRWARHVYQTSFREPFYKGGRVRERVPGWCDRILYCSRAWGDERLSVEQVACSDASRGASSFNPASVRDNYRALNDELRGSDHSPVSCTFLWTVQR